MADAHAASLLQVFVREEACNILEVCDFVSSGILWWQCLISNPYEVTIGMSSTSWCCGGAAWNERPKEEAFRRRET